MTELWFYYTMYKIFVGKKCLNRCNKTILVVTLVRVKHVQKISSVDPESYPGVLYA